MGTGAQPDANADGEPVFVGRRAQLDRLETLLARAADRSPGVVLVHGEVGVGRTRLLDEFAGRVRGSGSRVLWGNCVALGRGELPYAPLIDATRRLDREAGDEAAGPDHAELTALLADGAEGRAGGQSRVFDAVLRMIDRLGADRPVLFVVEDLQWADSATLDLFSYLARTRTNERLLLVGSYRTTDLAPRHPVRIMVAELDVARLVQHLEVPRFTREDLRQFLRLRFPGEVTHDLVERTFEATDGNPLFVEEVVADGVPTSEVAIAQRSNIRDLLLPRFELLGPDAQHVMGVAATAGRTVSHRLLEEVCELRTDRMNDALRECVDRHQLVTDPVDETYTFRHALLREVVHQRLIPGDRLRLHRRIAAALQANPELSYAESLTVTAELSYHWYAAKAYPQALTAAVRAGHDAARVLAFRAAGRQFDRALEVWDRVPDAEERAGMPKHELLRAAADAARWAGRIRQAVDLAETAVAEVDPMREPALAGEAHERLGSYRWEAGDHGGAERSYTRAAELFAGEPPSPAAARVLAVHAIAHLREGRTGDGLELGREALQMARGLGARAEEGRALNAVGLALSLRGDIDAGAAALREAVGIADGLHRIEDLFRAYGNLVYALEQAGRPDQAASVAVEGLEKARVTGLEHTRGRGVLANNLGAALFPLGRWDEATPILEQLCRDTPPAERLFPTLTLAEIAVARGDFDRATHLIEEARTSGTAVRQPQFIGSVHAGLAEIAIWQDRPDDAAAAVVAGLAAVGDADNQVVKLRLCAIGLRNEADDRARQNALRANSRDRRTEPLATVALNLAGGEAGDQPLREVAALRRLCAAESHRPGGAGQTAAWAEVAHDGETLRRPYWTAYARWREAAAAADDAAVPGKAGRSRAARDRVATPLRAAHRIAVELGAAPLRDRIVELAAATHIELVETDAIESASPVANPHNLTRREQEVLGYVSAGWSNRRIAQQLHIAEKTAGVHVSNILKKVGAPNRASAAAIVATETANDTAAAALVSVRDVRQRRSSETDMKEVGK